MIKKNDIIDIIFTCIEEINKQKNIEIEKSIDTRLFGAESDLDSLGLVSLVVSVEENINSKYDVSISIADERAMSQKHSPFRSVDTLSDYILLLLNDQ
jgi:acyl carrier protein